MTTISILNEVNICEDASPKIHKKMQLACTKYFQRNPVHLGSDGSICQIDETLLLHKPKNHRIEPLKEKFGVLELLIFLFAQPEYFKKEYRIGLKEHYCQ
ncbi:hypothetical protein DMUE_3944 [Dictyocoela muelleri]|nr:hypothetical protein DMUE_3944 [Dictyocoela muelleri]